MKEVHEFRLVITPFCNYRCFFCHGEGLTKEQTPLALTAEDYGFVHFVNHTRSEAKFIDLVTDDRDKIVSVSGIVERITQLGYKRIDAGIWQTILEKDGNKVYVTRCGFGRTTKADGIRSLFLNPDGTLNTDCKDDIPIDVLNEIKRRDQEMFIKKVNLIFAYF